MRAASQAREASDVEVVTVYRALDGDVHHARCGRRIVPRGRSVEELRFYCLACAESVTLPLCVLSRIPLDAGEEPAWLMDR